MHLDSGRRNAACGYRSAVDGTYLQSLKMQLIVTTVIMVPVTYLLAYAFLPES